MSVESQDYKSEVLEYAVNECIDRLLPSLSEDALSVIIYQCNEVVWRVATEIYSKSGHQVDFVFVRDILNLRADSLRINMAEEKRIRKDRKIEEARIRSERERIRKEQKAKLEAERLAKKAEQEKIRREKEAKEIKFRKQQEEAKQKKLQQFTEIYPNVDTDIFLKIEKIIIEQLEVEEEIIKLDSIFSHDLGADNLDIVELIMAVEEEFDIEIPDDFTGTNWISCICGDYSRLESITVKEIVNIVCKKIQHKY